MDKQSSSKTAAIGSINIIAEKVRVEGSGVILLTGPSSCGKGEIAKALCRILSMPSDKHLSMGDILRKTIRKAREEESFRYKFASDYNISDKVSIFDIEANSFDIVQKAQQNKIELLRTLKIFDGIISQLDWLEFCVIKGLLVPDEWTVSILDVLLNNSPEYHEGIWILDGYPRTKLAAEFLLDTLDKLGIPIIKVLHLSITKEEMKIRGLSRNRIDDTDASLERRYQFYIDKVLPCIDYLKYRLGTSVIALIDAHQPIYFDNGQVNVEASINQVITSALEALELPRYLINIE